MRILRRLIPTVIIAVACALLLVLPDIGPDSYRDLETMFRTEIVRQACPGIAVVAIRDGGVIFREAFGVDGTRQPMKVDTPVYLGPSSETLTGALALSLIQTGQLTLDDPVWLLPGTAAPENYRSQTRPVQDAGTGASISVAKLLTHQDRSDLPTSAGHAGEYGFESLELDPAGLTAIESRLRVHRSGSSYRILAQVMERQTTTPFADLLRKRITAPLGMSATFARRPTPAEMPRGSGLLFGVPIPYPPEIIPESAIPADGIVSTARDLGRFVSFIVAPKGRGIATLSSKRLPALYQPVTPGLQYGFGWNISDKEGDRIIHQGGSILGFASTMVLWPERRAAIVLVSAQGGFILSSIVLPSLAATASHILFEGKAHKPIPVGRILILLAVASALYLLVLVIQTGGAFTWAKSIKDLSESRGSLVPVILAAARTLAGILIRVLFIIYVPILAGRAFNVQVTIQSLFLLEPGIAAALVSACLCGIVRNLSRIVWLYTTTNRPVFFPILAGSRRRR